MIDNPEISDLLEKSDDQLLSDLGLAATFDPDFQFDSPKDESLRKAFWRKKNKEPAGDGNGARELGIKVCLRFGSKLHKMVCGGDDPEARKKIEEALKKGKIALVAILSGYFVDLGLSLALATLLSILIAKAAVDSSFEVLCEEWSKRLAGYL